MGVPRQDTEGEVASLAYMNTERMLAPRSLHFTKRQVFWDCASMSACESLPFGLPSSIDGTARPDRHWRGRLQEPEEHTEQLAGPSDSPLLEFWRSAVSKYTKCALTNREDKTIAIWGIAKLVRDGLDDQYGLGLWEQNLEDQLTWRVAECTLNDRPTDSKDKAVAQKFPSWSWASVDGRVEVSDRISKSNKKHWTVKNHSGRALQFDLVGVQRSIEPPSRLADAHSPTQSRGMSDTVVEQQARYRELQKMRSTEEGGVGKEKINAGVDRNVEPKFHSTSLPIAGHVGRCLLYSVSSLKGWRLKPEGLTDTEMDAFPDVIPKVEGSVDQRSFFVVLSAKQVVGPSDANDRGPYEVEDEDQNSEDVPMLRELLATDKFYISGRGILMKEVGSNRFHRTGAFQFSRISKDDWMKLLEPPMTKFWLD
jgi:hypothetical protein